MSLYDAAGGRWGLLAMIRSFYEKVYADSMIGFMFQPFDVEHLIQKEYELTALVLGHRIEYTGKGMREAHARHRITGGQFERRRALMREAMAEHRLPAEVQRAIEAHTLRLRGAVTADPGSDCHPLDRPQG